MKRTSPEDSQEGRGTSIVASDEWSISGSFSSQPSSVAASPGYRTPMARPNGRRFFGCSKITDYRVECKLGEGTFGEVHKARHRITGDIVALKKILMHNEKEGIPITAIREMKILKQLRHKNVVPLIDVAVERPDPIHKDRGSVFMVFPYMDHDLAGLLENPACCLTAPQIKTYMKQLLEGTAYLHYHHIMHRDLKASNLLINNEGILLIADFGLARATEPDRKEYTQGVVTRWYRPPELFLGARQYDYAIDMWGVGCVFAELLTSRPILQGQDDMDQLRRIFYLCGSPTQTSMPGWDKLPEAGKVKFEPSPRQLREEFSKLNEQAVDLLDQFLQLDPAQRLTAVDALVHDYFYTEPLPAKPEDLPKYEASHEYDRRRKANGAKAPRRHEEQSSLRKTSLH